MSSRLYRWQTHAEMKLRLWVQVQRASLSRISTALRHWHAVSVAIENKKRQEAEEARENATMEAAKVGVVDAFFYRAKCTRSFARWRQGAAEAKRMTLNAFMAAGRGHVCQRKQGKLMVGDFFMQWHRMAQESSVANAARFSVMESYLYRARCARTLRSLKTHAKAKREKAKKAPRRRKRFHPGAW